MRTTKISISIDRKQLRLARRAAKAEGMSLSAFIARGLGKQLEEHDRTEAAHALYRSWGLEANPTAAEIEELRRLMARPTKRSKKAA